MASTSTTTSNLSQNNEKLFNIYQYDSELAISFQSDCENLLNEFKNCRKCNFETFSKIWKKMQFSWIFQNQNYVVMLKTFTENCFLVAKKFFIYSNNYCIRAGAIFLLYGLYYKQPIKNWIKIRITSEEYSNLLELLVEAKNRNDNEVIYIHAKLTFDSAFKYVAIPQPLGPTENFIKRFNLTTNDIFSKQSSETCLDQFKEFIQSDEIFKNYREINEKYEKLKKVCPNECRGLVPAGKTNFYSILSDFYKELNHNIDESSKNSCINKVRKKAMKNKNAVYRGNKPNMANADNFDINCDN